MYTHTHIYIYMYEPQTLPPPVTFALKMASWMPPPPHMLYLGVIGNNIEHKINWGKKLLKRFMKKVKS